MSLSDDVRRLFQTPSGRRSEGDDDRRNDFGSGVRVYWDTYPGELTLQIDDETSNYCAGTFDHNFSGSEKKEWYEFHALVTTETTQHGGSIHGNFVFLPKVANKLLIDRVVRRGGAGKIGNVVLAHISKAAREN